MGKDSLPRYLGRIGKWGAHCSAQNAVYHFMECDCAVLKWTREDQRAAFQGPPVALLCSRTESPTISRHEIADWNCTDSYGLHMKNVAWWCLSSSILCATETAHEEVRRHLCRKTNPHSCSKTNPTGAKLKIHSKESTCRRFGSWFMVYIRSSNEGEQETNYEARNNESVVSKFCTSHLKFRPPSRFVFWRGRDTLQQSAT